MTNHDKIEQAFRLVYEKIQQLETVLPEILANEAVNDVIDNFESESFNGTPWPKRQDKKNPRKLLVRSGILRRSPQVYAFRAKGFTLGSDVPYAAVHNDGAEIVRSERSETFVRNRYTKGIKKGRFSKGSSPGQGFTFKTYTYNMPRRRFIGDSSKLRRRLYSTAQNEYQRIFNS